MWDKKTNANPQIDSTNIFEDFTSDAKLWEEIKMQQEKQSKDVFYYLKSLGWFLKIINLIMILGICVFLTYGFIQNRDTSENYSFLEPVCNLFLWDISSEISGCYGLNGYSQKISSELNTMKEKQFDEIKPLFQHTYELDNFANSKSVAFLLEKTNSRLRPLDILSDFDELKNKFESIDKSKIVCSDIEINDSLVFTARCEAYSSDWDSDITSVENEKKSGTSISVASGFLHFIENTEWNNFIVINKQKVFDSTSVSGNGIYTKKTDFDLTLRYTSINNLAL